MLLEEKNSLFDEKYELYGKMLYKLCMVHLKNHSDTEDAVQDIFIKLMYSSPEFATLDDERYWLIRVAINVCKNKLKSYWFKNVDLMDEDVKTYEEAPDKELLNLVLNLPVKYKAVIHLFYYEEYSVKEIAAILKIGESAVKARLMRGREKLKDELEGVGL